MKSLGRDRYIMHEYVGRELLLRALSIPAAQ
jgi:hypothetical protein